MATSTFVSNRVRSEDYHFHWKIENFASVKVPNELKMSERNFEVETGKSPTFRASWLIGLKSQRNVNPPVENTIVYFKLLQVTGCPANVSAIANVEVQRTDGSVVSSGNSSKVVTVGEEILVNLGFFQLHGNLDEHGALKVAIKLTIFRKVVAYSSDGNSANLEPSRKTAITKFNVLHGPNSKQGLTSNIKVQCYGGSVITVQTDILQDEYPDFVSELRRAGSMNPFVPLALNDVSGDTMSCLLHYLYTGEICTMCNFTELNHAAHRFRLMELVKMLENVQDKFVHNFIKHTH